MTYTAAMLFFSLAGFLALYALQLRLFEGKAD